MSELEKRCHIYTTKLFRKINDLLYILGLLPLYLTALVVLFCCKETSVKVNLQTQAYLTQAEMQTFYFTLALTAFG